MKLSTFLSTVLYNSTYLNFIFNLEALRKTNLSKKNILIKSSRIKLFEAEIIFILLKKRLFKTKLNFN